MRLLRGNSFAHKITLAALIATSIAVSTLMGAVLILDSISSRTLLDARLATLANVVGQNSTAALAFNDPTAAIEVLGALQAEPPVVTACLYDLSQHLFAEYKRNKGTLSCPADRSLVPAPSRKYPNIMHSILRRGEVVGTVVVISDTQELEQRRKRLLLLGGLLLALALAIGGLSASVLQRKISRPILDLSRAMQKVTTEKEFSSRVKVEGTDEIARLGEGFNGMLRELEHRESEKQEFEAKLKFQALNDPLTGLPNRRLFGDRLAQALAGAERGKRMLALLYIDLDGFKLVNDSLGHPIGDSLLVQVSERLRVHVRKSDTLARLGGDEFTVVLSNISAREGAMIAAKTLLDALSAPFFIEGHELTVGASIGISLYPSSGRDTSELMQQADSAMYAAKRNGKNQAMCFTPDLGTSVRERLNIENQLREALKRGEIRAHYQPEIDVVSGQLVRFEALARWTHPTLGIITPDRFIPVAEESGLIVPLGAHILEQACREAVKWNAIAPYPVQVAVNVSSIQFARPTFVEEVIAILSRTGLKPNLLQLELTESVMISGIHHSVEAMKRLKGLGITFAIDDFGTGYSCLSYLSVLPFDALKIDRSFVRECKLREDGRMLLESLINLAHNMGLRVIAEGVENAEQLDLIRSLGGSEAQGYLLGRPIPNPMATVSLLCQGQLLGVKELLED